MSSMTPLRIAGLVLLFFALGFAFVSVFFPVQYQTQVDSNRSSISQKYTYLGTPFDSTASNSEYSSYNFSSGLYDKYYKGSRTVYLYGTSYSLDSETYRIDTPKNDVAYEITLKVSAMDVSSSAPVGVVIQDKDYNDRTSDSWTYKYSSQSLTTTVCRGSYYVTFSSHATQSLSSVELKMVAKPYVSFATGSSSFCDQTTYSDDFNPFILLCIILGPLSLCMCCCAVIAFIKGAPKNNHQHVYNTHVQNYNAPQPVYSQPQAYGQPNSYGSPQPAHNQPYPQQSQPQYYGQGYVQPQAYGQPQPYGQPEVQYGHVQPAYVSTNEKQPLVEKTIE